MFFRYFENLIIKLSKSFSKVRKLIGAVKKLQKTITVERRRVDTIRLRILRNFTKEKSLRLDTGNLFQSA